MLDQAVPFSEEQVERIVQARIAGLSLRDIASDLSTNHRRIGRLLARPRHAERVRAGQAVEHRKAGDRERQRRMRERRAAEATPGTDAFERKHLPGPRDPADLSRGHVGSETIFPWIHDCEGVPFIHFSNVAYANLVRPATVSDYETYFPSEPVPTGLLDSGDFGQPGHPREPWTYVSPLIRLRPPVGTEDRDVFGLRRSVRADDTLELERLAAEGWTRCGTP